eukprot:TRINITY_DN3568_c0_g2_i2.p1 TRINITY_DN3568_c0_g2~~TRINITY_DN3568_c0_g2_i2.p1  ORF type:complete len:143 (+),score=14.93 TRINITY_DN3568_c0_g2_i2:293-721(+)
MAGVSRSATIVIGYIMHKRRISHVEAHEIVRKGRSIICPNPGFAKQLEMYHLMNRNIDPNHQHYMRFKNRGVTVSHQKSFQNYGMLPENLIEAPNQIGMQVFACSKCSQPLFTSNEIVHGDSNPCQNIYTCLLYTSPSPRDA